MNAWTVVSSASRRCLGRAPVRDLQLVRQPGRQHLERGCRQPRCLRRAVMVDVAGQLEEELRGHDAQPVAGRDPDGSELLEPAVAQRQHRRREHEGHHRRQPVFVDPARHLVGAARVVVGELSGRQPGLPAVLLDDAAVPAAHQEHFQHVGVGLGDQLRGAAHDGRHGVYDDHLHRPEAAGAELSPVSGVGLVQRTALHRHPHRGRHVLHEVDSVGHGYLVGRDYRAHPAPPTGRRVDGGRLPSLRVGLS